MTEILFLIAVAGLLGLLAGLARHDRFSGPRWNADDDLYPSVDVSRLVPR